jgi:hypothetical protein
VYRDRVILVVDGTGLCENDEIKAFHSKPLQKVFYGCVAMPESGGQGNPVCDGIFKKRNNFAIRLQGCSDVFHQAK